MLDFISKLNDKDAMTDSRNGNPRTSMHITKKTSEYYNNMQKELAKKGINATYGQLANAAIKIATFNKQDIAIAKMEQKHSDEQAKLQKKIVDLQSKLTSAVNQIVQLKSQARSSK